MYQEVKWKSKAAKMKVNIDKELLPMKAHYFLFNAGKQILKFLSTAIVINKHK